MQDVKNTEERDFGNGSEADIAASLAGVHFARGTRHHWHTHHDPNRAGGCIQARRSEHAHRALGHRSRRSRPSVNYSAMMMPVTALMRRRLHRLIKLMRVDLQAEHRLHIFASLCNVVGAMVTEMLDVLEPVLHLLSQDIAE